MFSPLRYLGVDVSKDTLVVAFERHRWEFANTQAGHRKLIAQIQKLSASGPIQLACEATGAYHLSMCLALQAAGIAVTICNPTRIHFYGRSESILAKNDPIDAALIERFANAKRPPADPPLSAERIALSELLCHRSHLVDCLKIFRTHRQQVLEAALRKEIDRSIAAVERRIEAIERQLKAKIAAVPAWKHTLQVLMSAKGVGFLTAVVLLVKMPELGSLNRQQCAALAGVAPYDEDSGQHHGKRSIRGGRPEVRRALYMAAITAVQFNPVLKALYQRLLKAKKPFKVAITAVMRKLLIYLNALLKASAVAASPTAARLIHNRPGSAGCENARYGSAPSQQQAEPDQGNCG
jgi:transposase